MSKYQIRSKMPRESSLRYLFVDFEFIIEIKVAVDKLRASYGTTADSLGDGRYFGSMVFRADIPNELAANLGRPCF